MWLEASVWIWAPIGVAYCALTLWRGSAAACEIRRLRARVAALEESAGRVGSQAA
jgi:hypothetical protein